MKLGSNKNVDPRNEEEFTRPVRLHRRDPRATEKDDLPETNDKDHQRLEIASAERDAQRAADMAQIAPSASTNIQKKAFKKKTQQVFRNDATPEGQARSKLRYEEFLPW